jgi:hypothetical protein
LSANHHSEDWVLQLGRSETEAAPEKPCHIHYDIASEGSIIVVDCFERPRVQRGNAVVCCPKIRIPRADREQRRAECLMRAVEDSLSCNHHNEGVLHGDVSRYLEAGPIQYPEEGPVQEEGGEGGKKLATYMFWAISSFFRGNQNHSSGIVDSQCCRHLLSLPHHRHHFVDIVHVESTGRVMCGLIVHGSRYRNSVVWGGRSYTS